MVSSVASRTSGKSCTEALECRGMASSGCTTATPAITTRPSPRFIHPDMAPSRLRVPRPFAPSHPRRPLAQKPPGYGTTARERALRPRAGSANISLIPILIPTLPTTKRPRPARPHADTPTRPASASSSPTPSSPDPSLRSGQARATYRA